MAHFFVTNSLNYGKSVKFNVTLRYFVVKGEEGEYMWTLEIGTTHLDKDGGSISPKRIHNISVEDFDEVIQNAVSELCDQIDWSPLSDDGYAPYIVSSTPSGIDVDIDSNVHFSIADDIQSAGINIDSVKVVINNGVQSFDITDQCTYTGDPFLYNFTWKPTLRLRRQYDT